MVRLVYGNSKEGDGIRDFVAMYFTYKTGNGGAG